MTKKKQKDESVRSQGDRFKEAAQKLIDAGELSPIDADAALNKMVQRAKRPA